MSDKKKQEEPQPDPVQQAALVLKQERDARAEACKAEIVAVLQKHGCMMDVKPGIYAFGRQIELLQDAEVRITALSHEELRAHEQSGHHQQG